MAESLLHWRAGAAVQRGGGDEFLSVSYERSEVSQFRPLVAVDLCLAQDLGELALADLTSVRVGNEQLESAFDHILVLPAL